ncbi:hypothetical protein ACP275_08G222300 [Erythranthe tilingii]
MMTSMANSFFTKSPSSFSCHRTPLVHSPTSFPILSHFKKGVWGQRFELLKLNCKSEECNLCEDSVRSLQPPSSSSVITGEDDWSISSNRWCAALGGIGFLETAYLTYLQITDSDAFFPTEWGSSTTILTSAYIPLFGMAAYGLFFITLKNFGFDKIKKTFGSQCVTSLVIIALIASCIAVQPVPSSLAEELPYVETEITKESSPLALSLARHLNSIGAKLYGAFWCSHCVHQKQMFGHDAAKLLDYVECYPDGVKAGAQMAKACTEANLDGFPSWEINGQFFSGTKQFPELARLSGIKLEDLSQQN